MCDNNNSKEKLKFNDKGFDRHLEINVPGLLPSRSGDKMSYIETETSLSRPEYNYSAKSEYILDVDDSNKDKEYRNFSLSSNKKRESVNHGEYINTAFKGHGRGFGDVEISQELRYGFDSRKEHKTATQTDLKQYKFEHMFANFHDENNVVLPFARGGIDTRNLDKYRNKN